MCTTWNNGRLSQCNRSRKKRRRRIQNCKNLLVLLRMVHVCSVLQRYSIITFVEVLSNHNFVLCVNNLGHCYCIMINCLFVELFFQSFFPHLENVEHVSAKRSKISYQLFLFLSQDRTHHFSSARDGRVRLFLNKKFSSVILAFQRA